MYLLLMYQINLIHIIITIIKWIKVQTVAHIICEGSTEREHGIGCEAFIYENAN